MECAWWRSENAKWTGNATNGNMIVCLHMIHLYIPFRGAGAGARAPAVAEKTYDILYLPTPFICGAINNIEINYRLKLNVINHFIFIISSPFRYCRLLSRVGVYVCRCVPPNDKIAFRAIFAYCVHCTESVIEKHYRAFCRTLPAAAILLSMFRCRGCFVVMLMLCCARLLLLLQHTHDMRFIKCGGWISTHWEIRSDEKLWNRTRWANQIEYILN